VPRPSQLPPAAADPAVSPLPFFLSLDEDFPSLNLEAHLHETDSPHAALSSPKYWPGTAQLARFVRSFILLPLQDKEEMCRALALRICCTAG